MKQKLLNILLCISALLAGCNNASQLTGEQNKRIKLEIIPANQVKINWDTTIYQHSTNWIANIDTLAGDSLVQLLNRSKLLIEEIWYPNEENRCGTLIRRGSEIILKLIKPDSLVYNYGFQVNYGGFPVHCFASWRHYKFFKGS